MNPSGQVAMVTGGSSGLGEATARALAEKGAKIAILDVAEQRAQKVAAELGGIGLKCDVSSEESAQAAMAEIVEKLGDPRILINCAGIGIAMKTVSKDGAHPLDLYRKVLEVNLVGSFNMIRLFAETCQELEPLEGGERGVIVNTASVAALTARSARPPIRPPRAALSA
jgi:NAD(P)-dependent dehydrogenase (short-subunit alcohol dehydrogenase family)